MKLANCIFEYIPKQHNKNQNRLNGSQNLVVGQKKVGEIMVYVNSVKISEVLRFSQRTYSLAFLFIENLEYCVSSSLTGEIIKNGNLKIICISLIFLCS